LLERNLDAWECSLRTWLVQQGLYAPALGKRLHATQTFAEYKSEDLRIRLLRVLYRTLVTAYDDRSETEKDVWDLRKLGIPFNRSQSSYTLNFLPIPQPWLRSLAKRYLKYNLAVYSASDCRFKLSVLRRFSQFLAETAPQAQLVNLDRALILHYLSFLVEQRLSKGTRNQYLVALRTFVETCAHRLDVAGLTKERIIFDDDLVELPEYGTREVPEEVLVQLRAHLDTLPTTTLRMVTILLEVGLRINELCQLPLDCLICDDKHEWYLRCYQSKTHREHVIPLVDANVIGTLQAQQQEIRAAWATACPYLFPSPVSHTKALSPRNLSQYP
jgi:integrase